MMTKKVAWLGSAVAVCGLVAFSFAATASKKAPAPKAPKFAKVGHLAPNFTLPSSAGKSHTLRSFKGKYIVLEWLNHGCPFVKKHYRNGDMQKLQAKYTKKGVVWLSIISSAKGRQGHCTPKQAEAQKKQKKANATAVLLDPSGKVGRRYRARTTPHMFVIGPKQRVQYAGAIDSIRSTDSADVSKAKNYVAMALNQLLKGKPVKVKKTRPYGCSVKYGE
jgi:peroxiredoxin